MSVNYLTQLALYFGRPPTAEVHGDDVDRRLGNENEKQERDKNHQVDKSGENIGPASSEGKQA